MLENIYCCAAGREPAPRTPISISCTEDGNPGKQERSVEQAVLPDGIRLFKMLTLARS